MEAENQSRRGQKGGGEGVDRTDTQTEGKKEREEGRREDRGRDGERERERERVDRGWQVGRGNKNEKKIKKPDGAEIDQ